MIQGYTHRHWKLKIANMPIEDAFRYDRTDKIIAVADGIHRDAFEHLPRIDYPKTSIGTIKNYMGQLAIALMYERNNPSKKIAEYFVRSVVNETLKLKEKNQNEIYKILKKANEEIKWANTFLGIIQEEEGINSKQSSTQSTVTNYTTKDLGGCTGALAAHLEKEVLWGYLCDAGLALINKNGEIKKLNDKLCKTPDEGPSVQDKYIWASPQLQGKNWSNPQTRRIIRRDFRNSNTPYSFGVFNGQENAINYIRTGSWQTQEGDTLLVYTDGAAEILFDKPINTNQEFLQRDCKDQIQRSDWQGLEQIIKERVATEATLVVSKQE